ncbi:MAG: UDP-N-acetylmuramoyl-L-alanine--D-glutamate ligase, partial [Elusimicrobia bacterium]|nr:UDP-N-acetylmuramoyl-L-alanine--D-glutamate ligase [Elusimicrobiota bacterium]
TNVGSARAALESFKGNIHLILGGLDKGASYEPLAPLVKQRVKKIYLIGLDTKKIVKDLSGTAPMVNARTLDVALSKIKKSAISGDIVLLSPACASFDQFKNYVDRGNQFKKYIK